MCCKAVVDPHPGSEEAIFSALKMTLSNACSTTAAKPLILHVSGDFPDPVDSFKTPVIRTLLDLTEDDFEHEVASLNRCSPRVAVFAGNLILGKGSPRLALSQSSFPYGRAVIYEAPPWGLFHATMLRQLGDSLAEGQRASRVPDLLVGHKLSIEGIVVRRAAARLNIPFAISVQGDTDTKILAARPDLAKELRAVFHEAAVVFPFTPWALQKVERSLGKRSGPVILLPCPTDLDEPLPPRSGGDGLVTVFHLKNRRRKNLRGLAAAMSLLDKEGLRPRLGIIGGGEATDVARSRSIVRNLPQAVIEGALDRPALRQRMNLATAFVLPSLRESYGLVFIEALFAGVPIVYPKGTAVDGYFDSAPFAIAVDARDPGAIAAGIRKLVLEEKAMKAELRKWQISEHAEGFKRAAIGRNFAMGLNRSLSDARREAA